MEPRVVPAKALIGLSNNGLEQVSVAEAIKPESNLHDADPTYNPTQISSISPCHRTARRRQAERIQHAPAQVK